VLRRLVNAELTATPPTAPDAAPDR
jgi:hypothetical protein